MPKKPVKWGMKPWCLCDSHTGYCLSFTVFTGSSDNDAANFGYHSDEADAPPARLPPSLCRQFLHVHPLDLARWNSDDNIMLCKWRDRFDVHMIAMNDAGDNIVRQLVQLSHGRH